jgi:hypothetical protein
VSGSRQSSALTINRLSDLRRTTAPTPRSQFSGTPYAKRCARSIVSSPPSGSRPMVGWCAASMEALRTQKCAWNIEAAEMSNFSRFAR